MRKLLPFLLITFLTSCSSSPKSKNALNASSQAPSPATSPYPNSLSKGGADYFASDIYGPFSVGDPDFDAKFTYRADIDNQKIMERLLLCDISGDPYVSTNHAPFNYTNRALIETTFTIPIHRYLTDKGLTLKFQILNSSSMQVLKSYSVSIYPCVQAGWTYEEYMRGLYITRNIGFYGNGKSLQGITEAYYFHHIGEYIDNDYYYRLDLNNNYMNYDSLFELTYDAINLKFEDSENAFPSLKHDSKKNVVIPLKATVDDEATARFSIKNALYVNKLTLEMADSYQEGYIKTHDLYFPINKRDQLNEKMMYMEFVNYGKSKVNMTFPMQYLCGQPYIGSSANSHYFVVGGVK